MRLIDADDFIEQLGSSEREIYFKGLIEEQPTAYDVEAVVKQIEEKLSGANFVKATQEVNESFYDGLVFAYSVAIEIVRRGGVK